MHTGRGGRWRLWLAAASLAALAPPPCEARGAEGAAAGRAARGPAEARRALEEGLGSLRAQAARAKDDVAAQVLDEVRRELSRGSDAGEGLVGDTRPIDVKTWLSEGIARLLGSADLLAGSSVLDDVVVGQMVRQVPDVVAALKSLNSRRAAAGLPPLRWQATRSRGAILHARYLARAGYREIAARPTGFHGEQDGDPNATAQGREAAQAAVMAMYPLPDTVALLLDTFIHRLPLLVPYDASIAMGTWAVGKETASVLLGTGERRGEGSTPSFPAGTGVLYPPPRAEDVPRAFYRKGEIPSPVAGVDPSLLGYPVSVTFYGAASVTSVEAGISTGGRPVPCYVTSPQAPANPAAAWPVHVGQSVGILPRAPLLSRAVYEVRVRCRVDGRPWERTWTFTTQG